MRYALLLVLTVLPAGCVRPAQSAKPAATVAPKIVTGDNSEVLLAIKQVQNTVQTTNYALDGERATLERKAARDQQKLMFAWVGTLVGMLLLNLFMDSPVKNGRRWIAVLIAFGIIIGSLVIPFVWPW